MMIIGVDYHPSSQQIAFLLEETGEYGDRQLNHSEGEAERFYGDLQPSVVRSKPAIRGHFKTGHMARDLDVVLCRSLSLQV